MKENEPTDQIGPKLKVLRELPPEEQEQIARTALRAIADAIVDTIESINKSTDFGVPAGVLYAALSSHGCTIEMFTLLIDSLVQSNQLERKGDLLYAKPASNN